MDRRREAPEPGTPEGERGALDVPIGPVAGGPSGRRRAKVVLSASIAVVGVAIALAVLPPKARAPAAGTTSDVALSAASASPSGPLASPTMPRPTSSSSRRETLLTLANEPLPGAPNPLVLERRGNDAQLVAWNPGEPLRTVRTFRAAPRSRRSACYAPGARRR